MLDLRFFSASLAAGCCDLSPRRPVWFAATGRSLAERRRRRYPSEGGFTFSDLHPRSARRKSWTHHGAFHPRGSPAHATRAAWYNGRVEKQSAVPDITVCILS